MHLSSLVMLGGIRFWATNQKVSQIPARCTIVQSAGMSTAALDIHMGHRLWRLVQEEHRGKQIPKYCHTDGGKASIGKDCTIRAR